MTVFFRINRSCLAVIFGFLFISVSSVPAREDGRWVVAPEVNALDDFNVMPNSTALARVMTEAAEYAQRWRLPVDAQAWWKRREYLEQVVLKSLGLDPLPERTPLNARIVARHDMGDYTIENVIFYSRPNFPVTANLYRPKITSPGKHPAVLCPIGHVLDQGKSYKDGQIRCIKLAKLGFTVMIYDAIGHGERCVSGNSHHEGGFALLPSGQTILGFMIWDSMRGIDFLQGLPEVDPELIGVTGNSGGGLNTLFTTALDDRVQCGVLAGYVYQSSNWIKYSGPNGTCCFVPGLYREMDWFEIAALAAPRAMMMLQGDEDYIFQISGARKAGRSTEALYDLLGYSDRARFVELEGLPHGYGRPFREAMYGWMLYHLMGKGDSYPLPEGDIQPLEPDDPRLICDKDGSVMAGASTVVEIACELGKKAVAELPAEGPTANRDALRCLVSELAAPPEPESHYMMPMVFDRLKVKNGRLEKVFFLSEVGQHLPGLLWLPEHAGSTPYRTVIMVDDRGKASVAESGLVEPLLKNGYAVLSVDLRGRGETLGKIGNKRDNNFNFVTLSVMWGRPVAGRRAYDLKRTVDFVAGREDLSLEGLTVIGLGDEVPAALIAAADDSRISRLACAGYLTSFVSQIRAHKVSSRKDLLKVWNAMAMQWGRLDAGDYRVDLGDVVPGVLLTADLPDIASLIAPRKLLYCQVKDSAFESSTRLGKRFTRVLAAAGAGSGDWARYLPDTSLDAELLLDWLIE